MLRKLLIPLKMIVVTFIYDIFTVLLLCFNEGIAALTGIDGGNLALIWLAITLVFGWLIKKIIFTSSSGTSISLFGSLETMVYFFLIKWCIYFFVYFFMGLAGLLVCNILAIYTIIFKCVKKEAF